MATQPAKPPPSCSPKHPRCSVRFSTPNLQVREDGSYPSKRGAKTSESGKLLEGHFLAEQFAPTVTNCHQLSQIFETFPKIIFQALIIISARGGPLGQGTGGGTNPLANASSALPPKPTVTGMTRVTNPIRIGIPGSTRATAAGDTWDNTSHTSPGAAR